MNYKELMEKSRGVMGTKLCKSCPICDGRACRNTIPGPGAKGIGDVRCVTMMLGKIFV